MNAKSDRQKVYEEVREMFGIVPQWLTAAPDAALSGFWALMRDFYLAETKIPNKYKELIGIAVSGATRCRYCTLFHTEAARFHGASEAEIAEASMMGGATMIASTWINAMQIDYDQFKRETYQMLDFARKKVAARGKPAAPAHA